MDSVQNLKIEFRETPVVPKEAELKATSRPLLRPNKLVGSYLNRTTRFPTDYYLDTWFRLMREDCIRPLREKIGRLRESQVNLEFEPDVYGNVRVKEKLLYKDDLVYEISFECNQFNASIDWRMTRKLRSGSLVCLCADGFNTLVVATVSDRTYTETLMRGKAFLIIPENTLLKGLFSKPFVMVESEAYFEAYRYNLEVLKTMNIKFSLQEVIINVEEIRGPKYLRAFPFKYDLSVLVKNTAQAVHSNNMDKVLSILRRLMSFKNCKHNAVDVLSNIGWPSAQLLGLDPSQLEAVKSALSREVSIIQGPPGTGKTYVGLKIVEILLANKWIWTQGKKAPILVVCYTNHALDQFLEGILRFTNRVVRFGGTCESEAVSEYTFFSWKEKLANSLDDMSRMNQDLTIINCCDIIGMTTTGAAKRQKLLTRVGPKIVIVEEAAEVLEPHLVTALVQGVAHLILIGDHKQLRPKACVHQLAVDYNFDVSLFERLINNGLHYVQLQVQHRMRPSIAALLVPEFYPSLQNHDSVLFYELIRGVTKSVFFINHSQEDSLSEGSRSFKNQHEAYFLLDFYRYLLLQGYDHSQITILAAYSAQMNFIQDLVDSYSDLAGKVRITSIDSYQGEEADIVLVSFVRSNDMGSVGFLRVPNRVNVALSRAKKGLYCIGNFEAMAQQSTFWLSIVTKLKARGDFGDKLELFCENHPDHKTLVSDPENFDQVPDGGCTLLCGHLFNCGHKCLLHCHPRDAEHVETKCSICEKEEMKCIPYGLPCLRNGYEEITLYAA